MNFKKASLDREAFLPDRNYEQFVTLSQRSGENGMKQKGFTLIELIVVIAIIGVLAAILVPTMLGYVQKSKMSSANANASKVYNAVASALVELSGNGTVIADGDYGNQVSGATYNTTLEDHVHKSYTQLTSNLWAVRIQGETPIAAIYADSASSRYIGAYPTNKDDVTDAADRGIKDLLDAAES